MKKTSAKTTREKRRELSEEDLGIKEVADIKRGRSFVFYGRSGTGKTTIVSTFPKPILLLDCKDEGTDSVADVEGLSVKDIESSDDLEDIYWFLKKNPKRFATVAFDTLTGLQQILVEEVLVAQKKDVSKAGDWGTMRKQDWGDVSQDMKGWITKFRELPMEIAFIAQDRTINAGGDEGDDSGQLEPEVGPRLMPSVSSHLNAAVSVIAHTYIRIKWIEKKGADGKKKEVRKTEYCLGLGPHPVYTRKVRKPRGVQAPDFITDPTYDDIIEVIEGKE